MAAMLTLAWVYLHIGMMFVGGGYVLIPLMHHLMVDHYKWLTMREFLDGLALSQLTPGPLAVLATFTGFRSAGFAGALLATICIFLPCTLFMMLVGRYYERLKRIDVIKQTLDNLMPAVVGLIAAAAWNLGAASLSNIKEFAILALGFVIFKFSKLSPMLVILGAGVVGFLIN